MQRRAYQRRSKLPDPRLQLRLVGGALGLCLLGLLAQVLVVGAQLFRVARSLPSGGQHFAQELPGILWTSLLLSCALLLPALLLIGIHATFRIAGPLYRFRRHLEEIAGGGWPEPCRIRRTDDLQDFCELLNAALESAHAQGAAAAREEEPAPADEELSAA